MYRVGFPFWKAAARAGIPVKIQVRVYHDASSNSYWAESDDLDGLVVSGVTLDDLQHEVLSAARTLLDLSLRDSSRAHITTDMRVRSALPCAA